MKEIILKYKIIIIITVLISSIFIYSNKTYSLYEIIRNTTIDNAKIYKSKTYYLNTIKKNTKVNEDVKIKTFYVKKNENISLLLKRINLTTPLPILKKNKNNCFYNIKINDEIIIKYSNQIVKTITKKIKDGECTYNSSSNLIDINKIKLSENHEQLIFFNKIESSFYKSAVNSGLNPNEIMSLADIFGWDLDFTQDIRVGDSFGVVLDRKYLNNKLNGSLIKYAVFKNRKKTFEAYFFKGKYYTKEGNALRKQFLKAPIDFYRISSHFNRKRLHPIFKTVRPHLGTDYAAPTGTPIYSTGDGKIIYKGTKGGYGKTIIIKHGNIYSTLYAHMSKYKKGMRVGKKVKQKEVIGYVGSTGYSTGPHVHYEFRVRGKHKNSRKIKFKKGKKLNNKNLVSMKAVHSKNESIYSWVKEAYK